MCVCVSVSVCLCACVTCAFTILSDIDEELVMKTSPTNVRDEHSIPGSGGYPGGGHVNPLWYSCLENPMDRGAWRAAVHAIAELDTIEAT